MSASQVITRSSLSFLTLLGLALIVSPAVGQVFDTIINVPPAPDIGDFGSIGDDGLTTQLNISGGGSIGIDFIARSGSEVNISGGTVGDFFTADSFSVVNISGGTVGDAFDSVRFSVVNISGGTVGDLSLIHISEPTRPY